jgi:hypothetical protein
MPSGVGANEAWRRRHASAEWSAAGSHVGYCRAARATVTWVRRPRLPSGAHVNSSTSPLLVSTCLGLALLAGGCSSVKQKMGTDTPAQNAAPASSASAPAAAAATPSGAKPGMNARGDGMDSSKIESGSGRTVKGLNDYEGEITGNPAPNSRFTKLQIGMPMRQVVDLVGPPTDQGAYITGKAFIPFYFGSDRHRYEMTYKGQGQLIFAGGGMGDYSSGNLIWIIHNPNEPGYR